MQSDKTVWTRTAVMNAVRGLWRRASTFRDEIILVAESDDSLRSLLLEPLHLAHYQTIEAADGAQAVRIAAQRRRSIDLLVTDVRLSDFLGWELGEVLRLDYPALKVLCFGCNPQDGWLRPRNKASFFVLPKPFSNQPVLQAIHRDPS